MRVPRPAAPLLCLLIGCAPILPDFGEPPVIGGGSVTPPSLPDCPEGTGASVGTTTGCVLGQEASGIESFLGIPYAEPPVGNLRFLPPQPVQSSADYIDGRAFGSPCVQTLDSQDGALHDAEGDEDCLTLNVWRPEDREGLPILFFVHGGQHLNGAGSVDDVALAPTLARGAVVVTHNARLGPFGYLAHPSLSGWSKTGASGNQGIQDTRLALKWVHDNAEALGGDPDRILLFGQEAGGLTVCALLLDPESAGLYSAALLESASCGLLDRPLRTTREGEGGRATGETYGEYLAFITGCTAGGDTGDADPIACLQSLSAARIQSALPARPAWLSQEGAAWEPVIDGVIIPDQPRVLFGNGDFNRVPVIAGVNAADGLRYSAAFTTSDDLDAFTDELRDLLEPYHLKADAVDGLVGQYNPSFYGSAQGAFQAFYTDGVFSCGTRRFLDAIAPWTQAYAYRFEQTPSYDDLDGAYAGAELPFVFGTQTERFNAEEQALSEAMQGAWTWAVEEEPTVPGLGAWPAVETGQWVVFHGDDAITAEPPRAETCGAWEAAGWQIYGDGG